MVIRLMRTPNEFHSLEEWQRHLEDLLAAPDNWALKDKMVRYAREMIERKRPGGDLAYLQEPFDD